MTDRKPPRKSAWKPGQSGNPAGRPKGTPNPQTRLRQMIDAEALVKVLEQQALNGDVQAARTLLERALPVYRTTNAPIELPDMDTAGTLTEKASAVLCAVADGRVPPDVGAQLVASIGSIARLAEIDELTRRIEQLENNHGKS